ncbi:zinc finger protein RFP isoform X1 [Sander lucioperca]|uniref:zinc finger protein RFP isoform X1 n=1 Tax=Sander lucioperca TaxID=283035 RepID=UPI00165374D0|nr:zinc finger protein RFP isoform X1 [Sander lucioperca]
MSQPVEQTLHKSGCERSKYSTTCKIKKQRTGSGAFGVHFKIRPTNTERMSLCGSFLSDEQFLCSICLDWFNNPSSTPCGHSFCMACISKYWDGCKVFMCPLCKKTFQKRPELEINRTLREITDQFRPMTGEGGVRIEKRGGRGGRNRGMPVNFIYELKKKLPQHQLKTALTLPDAQGKTGKPIPTSASTVTTSLVSSVPNSSPIAALTNSSGSPQPPPTFPHSSGRRRFTVTGAASSRSIPVCEIHRRGIVIYCRTDRACICPECETLDHQDHDTVTLETEWMETKKDQLSVSEQEIQEMIRQRIRKIEEIRLSVTELELVVERETVGSVCMLSELVSAIQRSQTELMEVMEMSRRAAEHQADSMIRQLELEVEELRRRESALAQLAQSDDYMHCVKTFPNVSSPPPTKDWSEVSVNSDLGTGTIYRSLAALVERFQEELKTIAETGFPASVTEPSPVQTQPRIRRIQEYAVDVTLDGNTAHPRLILSEDMKSVRCGDKHQMLADNPERFNRVVCVIGREAISSGRHYWEVEVGGKTDWDLGVARQSINRKGKVEITPSKGYWFLSLRDNSSSSSSRQWFSANKSSKSPPYATCSAPNSRQIKNKYAFRTEPSTDVHLNLRPNTIGIFVDYEKGQVSFYNVDAKMHIYTFNDTFSECIFPFFSPCTNKSGKNNGPLIIKPVIMTE